MALSGMVPGAVGSVLYFVSLLKVFSHARAIAQAQGGDNFKSCNRACYIAFMSAIATRERPAVISPRVYKKHRVIIKKAAHKLRVSDAEVVRRALEAFAF